MTIKFPVFKIFFLIFLLNCLFSFFTYSQSLKPRYYQSYANIDVMFSYSYPLQDLKGNIKDFFDFKNYGVKYGFGSQVVIKLSVNKKATIKPYLALGYDIFLGSDNNYTYIDSNKIGSIYPLMYGTTYTNPIPGNSKMFLHNFSAAGGIEYDFVNRTRLTPYLGAEINMNIMFGTYKQTPGYIIPAVPGSYIPPETSFTINSALRFGFGVSAGVIMRINQSIGLTSSIKYKFVNVFGKNSDRTSGFSDQNKMNLLDRSDTSLNSSLNKDRNIGYMQIFIGASFYISKMKK